MPFNLIIPQSNGTSIDLTLNLGENLFVLGANGTGKSSIMYYFYRNNNANAQWITAHRQTWFTSNFNTLSPEKKRNTEVSIRSTNTHPHARWKDDHPAQRASITIYDLIDAENMRAREITNAVDNNNIDLAKTLSKKDAPIKIINKLLRLSSLPIEITIHQNEQILASKSGSTHYSISELSDGERNAILIAANVLTVKEGTLLLIDEPERHLHRSIISPLLTLLFAERPDCAFVVSTHEVMLPLDNPNARTLLIRNCTFNDSLVTAWDTDLVPSETEIDGGLKREILGARRKVLFIEGTEQSLDKPLYSLIFPNVTIIAKSSCRDVEHAVFGIREADALHWLHAFGIVDSDSRAQEDIDRLKAKGVYAVSVFSVESIYYHPEIQRYVVERHAAVTGENASVRFDNAKRAALAAIIPHVQRLSERVSEKALREEFFSYTPGKAEIIAAAPINVSIDVAKAVTEERNRLQTAINNGDFLDIVTRYPIRETSALAEIAGKLGFRGREQYEGAVLKLLVDDDKALMFVKSLFGTLGTDIDAA